MIARLIGRWILRPGWTRRWVNLPVSEATWLTLLAYHRR